MSRIGAIGLGTALVAVGAWAQAPPDLTPAEVRELFLELDANNDTVLEADEVPESGRKAFEALLKLGDADKDGKLQASEMRALTAKAMSASPGAGQRFRAADKDGDGKLSRDEFPGRPGAFDRLDADKDGFLTREEVATFFRKVAGQPKAKGAARSPEERFKALDKDGDGKLSRDEFPGRPAGFDRLDADKDGFLSRAEVLPFFQNQAKAIAVKKAEEEKKD
jgi:Ca2+-binding EF-hand superfamily protein